MKNLKYIGTILIIISFMLSLYFYNILPDKIATHWDFNGNVNSYSPKATGTFTIPVMLLFLYILFILIPKIDPLKKNINKFEKYYSNFAIIIILFLILIQIQTIFWNLGYHINPSLTIPIGLAIIFFYSATLLENSKRNWFIGIRTPWTLSSDKVWNKTNKLGAKLFKINAIIILLGVFIPSQMLWFISIPILSIILITFSYSYYIYKK